MFNKNFNITILSILIIGVCVFYFYKDRIVDFQKEFAIAKEFHTDSSNKKAINGLERILPKAGTMEEEAVIKIMLGRSYSASEGERSLTILKEVWENDSYPELHRALAYQYAADAYLLGGRNLEIRTMYDDVIFSKEPYKSLVPEGTNEGGRILLGVESLYMSASELHSLPIAEYRTAQRFVRAPLTFALGEGKMKLEMPVSDYIKETKKHLELGDKALQNFSDPILGEVAIAYASWLRGNVLGYLAELEKNSELNVEAEKEFKNAIEILYKNNDVLHTTHALWANFYYAAFLENAYSTSRKEDISKLLAFMQDPRFEAGFNINRYGFTKFLRFLGSPSGWGYNRASALKLAKLDPNFSDFLKALGWKI